MKKITSNVIGVRLDIKVKGTTDQYIFYMPIFDITNLLYVNCLVCSKDA